MLCPLGLLKFQGFLSILFILELSYSKPLYSTLNYTSAANIQEFMKFYNLGGQSFEIDLSCCIDVSLSFSAISTFSEITKDVKVSSKLRELYKDVNEIDLWVGGLAEDHEEGSEIGPTFRKVFMETLLRIRDADRFWYEKIFTKEVRNTLDYDTIVYGY